MDRFVETNDAAIAESSLQHALGAARNRLDAGATVLWATPEGADLRVAAVGGAAELGRVLRVVRGPGGAPPCPLQAAYFFSGLRKVLERCDFENIVVCVVYVRGSSLQYVLRPKPWRYGATEGHCACGAWERDCPEHRPIEPPPGRA